MMVIKLDHMLAHQLLREIDNVPALPPRYRLAAYFLLSRSLCVSFGYSFSVDLSGQRPIAQGGWNARGLNVASRTLR